MSVGILCGGELEVLSGNGLPVVFLWELRIEREAETPLLRLFLSLFDDEGVLAGHLFGAKKAVSSFLSSGSEIAASSPAEVYRRARILARAALEKMRLSTTPRSLVFPRECLDRLAGFYLLEIARAQGRLEFFEPLMRSVFPEIDPDVIPAMPRGAAEDDFVGAFSRSGSPVCAESLPS